LKGNEAIYKNIHHEVKDVSTASCYEDIFQHLFDELKLLNVRLLKQLRIRQKEDKADDRSARGLFITEEEVISILNSLPEMDSAIPKDSEIESFDGLIREMSTEISNKLSCKGSTIPDCPLLRLARIFGLTPFELGVLIMAIAPEIDKRYERIFAYFNDDITKKSPSIALVLDILCSNPKDKLTAWRYFSWDAALLYFDLIHFIDGHDDGAFSGRRFRLDERIRRFIVGDGGLHETLSRIVKLSYPDGNISERSIHSDVKEKVLQIIRNEMDKNTAKTVFWLHGKGKEEKKVTVQALCGEIGLPLLMVDPQDIVSESDQVQTIRNLFREAALQSALVFLSNGDYLYAEDEKSKFLKRTLLKTISEMSWVTFISAEALWIPEDADGRYQWYPFEFKLPGYTERKKIWVNALNGNKVPESDIEAVSARFHFSENQIRNAILYAQSSKGEEFTIDSIYRACTIQSNQRLSIYSTKVNPHYIWDDIVLPEDKIKQLRESCNYIKNKHIVYFKWGFERKLALGRGLNILFSGPSGTGKTMAADIIANELKLEMYKIDLSSIVSKYIGETEKNLNRIFRETSSGNIILFFDEADALFGKRSEVKDAHDRYANIEINYLLQKMEEHEGIVILATNLSKNIDEAFLRRLHFSVEFPFPDEVQRDIIWRNIFPQGAPLSEDIDYKFLSEKLKVAGGNIKNIALTSAFYAAEGSTEIEMAHIMLAAKREYQKMGKSFLKADFEPYYELMEGK